MTEIQEAQYIEQLETDMYRIASIESVLSLSKEERVRMLLRDIKYKDIEPEKLLNLIIQVSLKLLIEEIGKAIDIQKNLALKFIMKTHLKKLRKQYKNLRKNSK